MRLLQALSETHIGRALVAYFFDLPRWTLTNVMFALALIPAYLALTGGQAVLAVTLTFPASLVLAAMVNMAAGQTVENAPRWRDATAYPATYVVALLLWLILLVLLTPIFVFAMPPALIFVIGMVLFSLLLVGVYALFVPALLQARAGVIAYNALVLAVHSPVIGIGMLALALAGVWVIVWSKGTLIVVVPALWVLITAFSVAERITVVRAAQRT